MTREEQAVELLRKYLVQCPAFRAKRVGAPGSEARQMQESHAKLEDESLAFLNESPGNWHCPRCEGSGEYKRFMLEPVPCALCKGTGKMSDAVASALNT